MVTPKPPTTSTSPEKPAGARGLNPKLVGLTLAGGFAVVVGAFTFAVLSGSDDVMGDVDAAGAAAAQDASAALPNGRAIFDASLTADQEKPAEPILSAVDDTAPIERHARYSDGKIYLVGPVRDEATGAKLEASAAEVIGAENVFNQYVIDPSAPATTDGRVVVEDPILFASGSAHIAPSFEPLLNLGVALLTLNPDATTRLSGHTDASEVTDDDADLGRIRAQAVADYLIAGGIDPARIEVIGVGSGSPISSSDTADGRAKNRRIDVEILGLIS